MALSEEAAFAGVLIGKYPVFWYWFMNQYRCFRPLDFV